MNLWHALRRECAGAWRSVRYDLATHRSARLAGAYTEEFQPGAPPVPTPSRLVPVTGVALLLVGGAAGAFLAISGGLAALGEPGVPPAARDYAATASTAPAAGKDAGAGGGASPVPVRRAAADDPRPSPTPTPSTPVAAPPPPVTEGTSSSAPPSASTSASTSESPSASASTSTSQSSGRDTDRSRSRGHRGRR